MKVTLRLSVTRPVSAFYIRKALLFMLYLQSLPSQALSSSFDVCISTCTKARAPIVRI